MPARSGDRSVVEGTVTLLFTDLVGSTELLSRIGDEAAENVRRAHFQLLRQAVSARGGHEVKNLGDGLMVAFPSAADAVRCAVDMQQAIGRRNLRAEQVSLSVRVGLHVGEPIRDEDDYFGTPVVVAQRLCDAASGGEIVASHLVRALAGSGPGVRYTDLAALELKGLSEPVLACSIEWDPTPGPLPLPAGLAADIDALFVDRRDEIARLSELWNAARGGDRQLAFVVGEPGIGKTRLCAELAKLAGRGGIVLYGHSDEETLVPYQPFVEAVRPYLLSLPDAALAGDLAVDVAHVARLMPELAERIAAPGARGEAGDDPATERYRLFEAITEILDHAAQTAPVLLVLDDMQWSDKPTVLLLRHLIRSPRPQRLFVLGTYRDTEVGPDRPLGAALADLRRDHRYERIRLRGLAAADVAAMTGEWGDAELARVVGQALFDETEGNPFFVAETLRHLAETGAIRNENGRWVADASAAEFAIPEGVREVVTRRLARLTDAARRVLSVAAVIGTEFELRPLAAVVELDESDVLDVMDAGVAAQVIVEAPGAVDRYVFSHALIRRTLHDDMSTTRRVRLHRRIAEAIESQTTGSADRRLAQLAFHYGEAAVAGGADKAVTYAMAAGNRAMELVAYEEAAHHFNAALQAVEFAVDSGDAAPERRDEVLLVLADAEWRSGEYTTARRRFAEVAESAGARDDVEHLARAALGYGGGLGGYGQTVSADETLIDLLERALASVGHVPTALRVRLLGRLATELYYTSEVARRTALAEEAVAIARSIEDPAVLGVALISREAATWGPDRPPADRLASCDEIIRLSIESGERQLGLEARSLRMDALVVLGDIEAADEEHRARSHEAEALRMPQYLADAFTYPSARALLAGDFAEAQRLADHTVEVADPVYTETTLTLFGAQVICLHWLRGELEGLAPMVEDFATRFPWIPAFRGAHAFVLAETGALDEARERVAELAPDHFSVIPRDGIWMIGMWTLAGAVYRLDDRAWAAEIYDLLLHVAECSIALGASMYLGPAAIPLGQMATVLGRYDEGAAHFDRALNDSERAGARPFRAQAAAAYSALLRRRSGPDDAARADELARHALDTATELGMAALVRDLGTLEW